MFLTDDDTIAPTPAQLRRAADEVEKPGGWCQGMLGAYDQAEGAVCAQGAILRSMRGDHIDAMSLALNIDFTQVRRALATMCFSSLAEYNDKPGRTSVEVGSLLRWIATRIESEEP